jgi:hypothetical protein
VVELHEPNRGELKRGEASLTNSSPSPFKERGIKRERFGSE